MSMRLIKKEFEKEEKIVKTSRTGARIKVSFRRIKEILKIVLFIMMIVIINLISNRATNFIQQMTFEQMKIVVFTFITTTVLYVYLKSCEEVKELKNSI